VPARPPRSARIAARCPEAVVGLRHRDRGDLAADQHAGVFLRPEAMVELRRDRQARAMRDLEHLPRGEFVPHAVTVDVAGGGLVHCLVVVRVEKLDHQRAAVVADDVLGLLPVKVIGQPLAGLQHEDLFAVRRAFLRLLDIAVAHVEHRDADLIEVSLAEVGDGPSQSVARHACVRDAGLAPVVGTPVGIRRQPHAMLGERAMGVVDGGVDLRAFHGESPESGKQRQEGMGATTFAGTRRRGLARRTLSAKTAATSSSDSRCAPRKSSTATTHSR